MRNGLRSSPGFLYAFPFILLALAGLSYPSATSAQPAPVCTPPSTTVKMVGDLTFIHDTYVCPEQSSARQTCLSYAAGLGFSSTYCAGPGGSPGYSGGYSAGWLPVGLTKYLGNFNYCYSGSPRFSWSQDSLNVFRWSIIGDACIPPPGTASFS